MKVSTSTGHPTGRSVGTTTVGTTTVGTTTVDITPVELAARRLYDAETVLHTAHTSHVDQWITAAADRLHEAVEAYLAARAPR